MAKDSPYLDPYEAVVADLEAKRAEIDAALAAIRRYRAIGAAAVAATPVATIHTEAPAATLSESSPFFGLGFREASPKQLAIVGKPQTVNEIWEALKAAGYQTAHNNPPNAVHTALRRREKTHHDVLVVGEGKWGRTEWYSEAQLDEIKKSVGGMGGRDRAAHVERTKAGMQRALERGAKPGAPPLITPEKLEEARQLIMAGVSVPEIAERFGVSKQALYNRWNRAELRDLREQGRAAKEAASTGPEPAPGGKWTMN